MVTSNLGHGKMRLRIGDSVIELDCYYAPSAPYAIINESSLIQKLDSYGVKVIDVGGKKKIVKVLKHGHYNLEIEVIDDLTWLSGKHIIKNKVRLIASVASSLNSILGHVNNNSVKSSINYSRSKKDCITKCKGRLL